MSDGFNSPFNNGDTWNNPVQENSWEPKPVETQPSQEAAPVTVENREEEPVENKPAKRTRSPRRSRSKSTSGDVTPELVDAIVSSYQRISALDEGELGLLRLLLKQNENIGVSKIVAEFVSAESKKELEKSIDSEIRLIDSLDEPFKAALLLAGLTREERMGHWLNVAMVEPDKAREIAGTDNGRWPRDWRDAMKESQGVYRIYSETKDSYKSHLEHIRGLIK